MAQQRLWICMLGCLLVGLSCKKAETTEPTVEFPDLFPANIVPGAWVGSFGDIRFFVSSDSKKLTSTGSTLSNGASLMTSTGIRLFKDIPIVSSEGQRFFSIAETLPATEFWRSKVINVGGNFSTSVSCVGFTFDSTNYHSGATSTSRGGWFASPQ